MVLPSLTSAYTANQFEPLDAPAAIRLTGNTRDQGIDTNGNGLYDLLEIGLEVELARDDFYSWSARLVSDTGIELGFTTGNATLNTGIHEIILNYDGLVIGNSAINGPYSIKGLLMFGSTGPNLVAVNVADTGSYSYTQFEGSNLPPIANAGPDQNIECSDEMGATVWLDASASSDPDGDDLTYQWSGSFGNLSGAQVELQLPLGIHMISLTVDDGRGGIASDSMMVIVEDTTPPQVNAELIPIGETDDDEGWFKLQFSCLDACSATPVITAELNGISVENGQRVYLELDDEHEARYQRDRLHSLEAPSFELVVSCTDSSGNLGIKKARPLFIGDDENEDD